MQKTTNPNSYSVNKRYYVTIIVGAFCFVLSNITTWFLSGHYYTDNHKEIAEAYHNLCEQNDQLTKQNDIAKNQISELKHTNKIDKITIECARQTITKLETKRNVLSHKINFYRNLLAPEQAKATIQFQDIILLEEKNHYYIQLTVVHVDRSPPILGGTLTITLYGTENNKPQNYNLLTLADYDQPNQPVGFRYFQTIPEPQEFIKFSLPKNFTPETVSIKLIIKKGRKTSIEQYYRWNTLLSQNENTTSTTSSSTTY